MSATIGGTELEVPATFFEPLPTAVEESFYATPITSGRGVSTAALVDRAKALDA